MGSSTSTPQLCQAFQEFNGPFLVTKGGPNGATTLISMLIYNNAFLRHKMGINGKTGKACLYTGVFWSQRKGGTSDYEAVFYLR